MSRPDYICCIKDPQDAKRTLCGVPCSGWAFADIDHAYTSATSGSRLLTCSQCCAAVLSVFSAQKSEQET